MHSVVVSALFFQSNCSYNSLMVLCPQFMCMMLWTLIDAVYRMQWKICAGYYSISFNILPLAYQMLRFTIYDAVSFVHI